jgi:hypothetical protein
MQVLGMVTLAGGVWVFQDALASILYYLKDSKENWSYNHACRLLRALWGLVLVGCGVLSIRGGW